MGLTFYLHQAAFHLPTCQTDRTEESDRGEGGGEENEKKEKTGT